MTPTAGRTSSRLRSRNGRATPDPRGDAPESITTRLGAIAGFIAPTTVIAALAYYYGYVTTRAKYAYFGIDLAALRLTNQDLTVQSIAAVYVPLAALIAATLLGYVGHLVLQDWVDTGNGTRRAHAARVALLSCGLLMLARAVIGILVPDVARSETVALTPTSLGLGALLTTYGMLTLPLGNQSRTSWTARRSSRRPIWYLTTGLSVLALFWIANSFAGAYGSGEGELLASQLDTTPSITVDTHERLYVTDPGIVETSLPDAPGQEYHFRYRNFHLLAESGGRLFLTTGRWERGKSSVVLVPDDGSTRLTISP